VIPFYMAFLRAGFVMCHKQSQGICLQHLQRRLRVFPSGRCALTLIPLNYGTHHFTLTQVKCNEKKNLVITTLGRCFFCYTFHHLAMSLRYKAPCPMKPGLSSPKKIFLLKTPFKATARFALNLSDILLITNIRLP
jgi:hypothetical protein